MACAKPKSNSSRGVNNTRGYYGREGRLVSWVVGIQKGHHIKIYVNFIKCLRRIKTTHTHTFVCTQLHTYTHREILAYVSETCKCNANRRENSTADKRQLHLRIRIRNLATVSRIRCVRLALYIIYLHFRRSTRPVRCHLAASFAPS